MYTERKLCLEPLSLIQFIVSLTKSRSLSNRGVRDDAYSFPGEKVFY